MDRRQREAFAYPCYFGFETFNSRYKWPLRGRASLVLTVNTGYE